MRIHVENEQIRQAANTGKMREQAGAELARLRPPPLDDRLDVITVGR